MLSELLRKLKSRVPSGLVINSETIWNTAGWLVKRRIFSPLPPLDNHCQECYLKSFLRSTALRASAINIRTGVLTQANRDTSVVSRTRFHLDPTVKPWALKYKLGELESTLRMSLNWHSDQIARLKSFCSRPRLISYSLMETWRLLGSWLHTRIIMKTALGLFDPRFRTDPSSRMSRNPYTSSHRNS